MLSSTFLLMKKVCFIELEGVLSSFGSYVPNERRLKNLLDDLIPYCKKKKVELFIISGHHETIAQKKLLEAELHTYFDKGHFLFVDEEYISSKAEVDQKLHRDGLEKDPHFIDSYFKQVAIQKILAQKKIPQKDALLFGDDLWVDGYYTMRFSKIDFALFEENLLDRGKQIQLVSGLAYFKLEFDSVKLLIEKFPKVDNSALDKYVFEAMKKVLIGDNFVEAVKRGLVKKTQNN